MSQTSSTNFKYVIVNKDTNITDLEDIISSNSLEITKNSLIPDDKRELYYSFMNELTNIDLNPDIEPNPILRFLFSNSKLHNSYQKFEEAYKKLCKKYKTFPKKSQIYYLYRQELYKNNIPKNIQLEKQLITKHIRSQSGVLVISVIMPPDNFSCSYNCYYCPNDPKYSRSYFKGEPTVQRGEQNNFDAYKQFYSRAITYFINGHPIDKVEIIILGGTFSCYSPSISENFIRDLFYASNTIFDSHITMRERKSLFEEIEINEHAICKIIGITVETRPDKITKYELRRFRSYGVTRIQMGVQHTDDLILEKVNRQCTQVQIKKGIKLAKDNGFKIDIHIMPDLPDASPEIDHKMFQTIINDPDYQADQWKIYPTNVLEFTEIKKWYDEGSYVPYAETNFNEFINLLIWVMKSIPPWIRINRIQRDFPGNYIEGGNKITNLRQVLDNKIAEQCIQCKDIRSMEVKLNDENGHKARIVRIDYDASDGKEIFLSHKSCNCFFCWKYFIYQIMSFLLDLFFGITLYFYGCGNEDTIYSFLRLRISSENYENCFAESFRNKGKIRELHVYGKMNSTYESNGSGVQHHGFGRSLLSCAEKIAFENNCDGTCVIAGVGTRNYYRKFGYEINYDEKNHGTFMIKNF